LLLACEDKSSSSKSSEPAINCDLSVDSLAGTEWTLLRSEKGKEDTPELRSRVKFYEEDSKVKAKYTVGSLSDMYEYDCTSSEGKLNCAQAPDYELWCATLMANNKKCTVETLNKYLKVIPPVVESEDVKKGIAAADKIYKQQKAGAQFDGWKNSLNNLGNKLQGLMYAQVNEKTCNLRITDNYMTFYNAKRVEDSNPNGINAFVKHEGDQLLWEDCKTTQLFDTLSDKFPEKPEAIKLIGKHKPGANVHYWLLYSDRRYKFPNCEYTFDMYLNYKLIQKDLKPEVRKTKEGNELSWGYSQKFDTPSLPGQPNVTMMVTKMVCTDKKTQKKKEDIVTACNQVTVK
jgi:hypothetical protein